MKLYLDWSSYENAGMGDAYANIQKNGGYFAKPMNRGKLLNMATPKQG
jgi:hypothetical protein